MSKNEIDKSFFVAFCIEQYKMQKGIDGAKAAEIFFSTGVADYLSENFEVLHTQGKQWLMEEIENYIQTNSAS